MSRLIFALLLILLAGATYYGGKTAISQAGIGPDNPLYFFDGLMERLDIWGTKDKEKKAEKLIDFLNEKYAEAGAILQKGDEALAKIALKAGDKYGNDALTFINHLKSEGQKTEKLAEGLAGAVLEKQEILATAYKDAPPESRAYIEEAIKRGGGEAAGMAKNFDATASGKFVIQIEQMKALASDKISEAKEAEEKKTPEDLTKQEQLYNIWIEHFYYTSDGGAIGVSAHIRRRDPECSEFRGKFNLSINNNFYQSFNVVMGGYDDLRNVFSKIILEKGSHKIKGELFDESGRVISRREFELVL